jgi:putative methionine-R-sulfoxide reductase with GAF domain
MPDELLLRKAECLVNSNLPLDEVLRRMAQLLFLNVPHYHWVGIYVLKGNELVLHNYIGKPTDHQRIPVGRGVCGTAVAERASQVVGDVTRLDNYLACSVETKSEIVVLIQDDERIYGQIDIDSDEPNAFGPDDESFLNAVAGLIAERYKHDGRA